MTSPVRALVTRANGFLGREICRQLVDNRYIVGAVDVHETASLSNVEYHQLNISNADEVRSHFMRFKPQTVFHLAAVLTPESKQDVVRAAMVNCVGTAACLAAAAECGAERVVYASSSSAISNLDVDLGDAAIPQPENVYGATKAFSEHLASAFSKLHPRMILVGLRYGLVYGPGRTARGWRDLQAALERVLTSAGEVKFPDIAEPIDWTWFEDAAAVAVACLGFLPPGHRVFNVVGDKRTTEDAIAILQSLRPSADIVRSPLATPPGAWRFRNDRLETAIGKVPETTLEVGLQLLQAMLEARP